MPTASKSASRTSNFEALCKGVADGRTTLQSPAEEIQRLPTYESIKKIGGEIEKISNRIEKQDDGSYIDWTLEDYITNQTGVQSRLERINPGSYIDIGVVAERNLYGTLKLHDKEYFLDVVEEYANGDR